jgi:hypothetical protein
LAGSVWPADLLLPLLKNSVEDVDDSKKRSVNFKDAIEKEEVWDGTGA